MGHWLVGSLRIPIPSTFCTPAYYQGVQVIVDSQRFIIGPGGIVTKMPKYKALRFKTTFTKPVIAQSQKNIHWFLLRL